MAEPDEGAADGGIVVRRPFAREVGQEGQSRRRLQRLAHRRGEIGRAPAGHPRQPVQAVGRRQDHPHLVPGGGQRMAEGVHCAFRIGQITVRGGKEHARCAERDEGMALGDRAHATRGRGVVAGPAGHDDIAGQAPGRGDFAPNRAAGRGPLDKGGHVLLAEMGRGQQFGRPAPVRHVEPGGAGRVRHLGDVLAGEPEAEIVLRQQDLRHSGKDLRLVGLHPGELGRREAREDDVAADGAEARVGVEPRRFQVAARVVPQDAGAQHRVRRVEERRAVHLARQADPAHRREFDGMGGLQRRNRLLGRADPVGRVLFRPAGMRSRDGEMAVGGADDGLRAVHEQRLDPRRPEVEPEIHRFVSSPSGVAGPRYSPTSAGAGLKC